MLHSLHFKYWIFSFHAFCSGNAMLFYVTAFMELFTYYISTGRLTCCWQWKWAISNLLTWCVCTVCALCALCVQYVHCVWNVVYSVHSQCTLHSLCIFCTVYTYSVHSQCNMWQLTAWQSQAQCDGGRKWDGRWVCHTCCMLPASSNILVVSPASSVSPASAPLCHTSSSLSPAPDAATCSPSDCYCVILLLQLQLQGSHQAVAYITPVSLMSPHWRQNSLKPKELS